MRKKLTDEEREFKRKERNRKLLNSYKVYDDGIRGSTENWKKVADILWGHDQHTENFRTLGIYSLPSTEDELKKIWKKSIVENHPDRGGDASMASKINEAYDSLKKFYLKTPNTVKTQKNTITPASASHVEYDDYDLLWNDLKYINRDFAVEVKLDGSRYLLYIEDLSKLLSRRISDVTNEFVDKSLHCPHLTRTVIPREFWGTILDGELIHPTIEKSDATTSVMVCSSEEAVNRQLKNGWLKFRVYDVPRISGEDITSLSCRERRERLVELVDKLKPYIPIELHEQYPAIKAKSLYEKTVANGGEGVMLKDLNAPYGSGWYKVKKFITQDVIILGYTKAKKTSKKVDGTISATAFSKDNLIGAIIFGMYVNGQLTELGRCSGMSATIRKELSINGANYIGQVIEVKAHERTKSGSFRHVRFVCFRPDKSAKECKE